MPLSAVLRVHQERDPNPPGMTWQSLAVVTVIAVDEAPVGGVLLTDRGRFHGVAATASAKR